jgi:hypothetical protein
MKKYLLPLILVTSMLVFSGCAIFTTKGKAAKAEEKSRVKIANVETKIAVNMADKMDTVATLAYGTDYALSKVNEPPREVTVARDMNQRVISIAGTPSIEKMKEMQGTIDKLTSMLATERDEGKKLLDLKDLEINDLQSQTKLLVQAKDAEIRKYMVTAQEAAATADAYKSQLAEYQGWFGLKAVFKGLWQFIKSSMWILGIGSILFLILRFASMSNPIAASIFSIFNIIGSWVVNGIKLLLPKALDVAGHTATSVFNAYKGTMYKLIDGIQILKERQKAIGDPNKKFTLDELMAEFEKIMSDEDKKRVTEIKQEIGYK